MTQERTQETRIPYTLRYTNRRHGHTDSNTTSCIKDHIFSFSFAFFLLLFFLTTFYFDNLNKCFHNEIQFSFLNLCKLINDQFHKIVSDLLKTYLYLNFIILFGFY